MDQTRFQEAQQAYDAGDYRTSAKGFLASAGRGAEGNGAAYHMAGNSLIRLRRHQDAVTVYGHALRDVLYEKRGSVFANLGAAYVALGDYAAAAQSYESALAEPDYATPYKAFQGLAGALLERGRIEDAAVAYRKAALDPGNLDPGKALLNLGLCFMGLGRWGDAAEAYKAALGFDEYQGRGKALANLGQAYVALEQYDDAARAFEKATQLHGHKLSAAASAAYATAAERVRPHNDTVDGWETGELGVVMPNTDEVSDWDTSELAALTTASVAQSPDAATAPSDMLGETDHAEAGVEFGDDESVADFFSVTEDQLRVRDRESRKAEREAHHNTGGVWKLVVGVLVAIAVIGGVLGAAYYTGAGWPTQKQSVAGMLSAYGTGASVSGFWVAVPVKDVAKEMAKVPPLKTYAIDGVTPGPRSSTVLVTVTPKSGAPLHYTVTLAREGVGWKVNGVDNDWRSTGGGK